MNEEFLKHLEKIRGQLGSIGENKEQFGKVLELFLSAYTIGENSGYRRGFSAGYEEGLKDS